MLFDVSTGAQRDAGVKGGDTRLRYSSDGKYLAMDHLVRKPWATVLRVVSVEGKPAATDLGHFQSVGRVFGVGRIEPTDDGRFLVTGTVRDPKTRAYLTVGACCDPGARTLKELWRAPLEAGINEWTSFRLDEMIGVSTGMHYLTQVTDLRAGQNLLTIEPPRLPPEPPRPPEEARKAPAPKAPLTPGQSSTPSPPPVDTGPIWARILSSLLLGLAGMGLVIGIGLYRLRRPAQPSASSTQRSTLIAEDKHGESGERVTGA
jgi:hypothetical protein